MPTSYGERLAIAIKEAKSSRALLAEELKLSVQAIGQCIRGETGAFKPDNSAKAARFLKVDHFWLATGDGPMKSETVWPFDNVSAAEFFSVDESLRKAAEDVILGALQERTDKWKRYDARLPQSALAQDSKTKSKATEQ